MQGARNMRNEAQQRCVAVTKVSATPQMDLMRSRTGLAEAGQMAALPRKGGKSGLHRE